ncbi:hypothetical protein CcrColossus_gp176 [Caulobacter phage CcrColossus]|uniref:Uncharacterized protein n=1 Tax=Caulobacter phage CcrColossus TaxID=1211640 RepID=K4JSG0_9CAUD|nr:hypothetical protein CcrColossus_gp176 [Caulobacter phage CcrColossus]AFU88046.1 hypothetical protein CcrColossus_gp176 [Caulobacter phage CcrColossus]
MTDINLKKPTPRRSTATRKTTAKPAFTPIPVTEKTRLGIEIRDPMSALKGFASARLEFMSGNIQYAIQPRPAKGDAEKVMDAHFVDYHLLEQIGVGYSDKLPAEDDTVTIKIGDYVYDHVSGYRGVAVEKWTFANGCVYFAVQPKRGTRGNFFGELPSASRFPHGRLRLYTPWYAGVLKWFKSLTAPKPRKIKPITTAAVTARTPSVAPPPAPTPYRRPPGGPGRVLPSRTL